MPSAYPRPQYPAIPSRHDGANQARALQLAIGFLPSPSPAEGGARQNPTDMTSKPQAGWSVASRPRSNAEARCIALPFNFQLVALSSPVSSLFVVLHISRLVASLFAVLTCFCRGGVSSYSGSLPRSSSIWKSRISSQLRTARHATPLFSPPSAFAGVWGPHFHALLPFSASPIATRGCA
jgi:hypothetical protein